MSNQHHDIKHALDKIEECVRFLQKPACTVHKAEYRHNVFQLSYNAGRLSELTGKGREIYDELKPEIASGLLNGWHVIESVIVPQWREKFLVQDPDRELYFAEYDSEVGQVIIMEKIDGGYWIRMESDQWFMLQSEKGNCGSFTNCGGDLLCFPGTEGLLLVDSGNKRIPLTPAAVPAPRDVQLV